MRHTPVLAPISKISGVQRHVAFLDQMMVRIALQRVAELVPKNMLAFPRGATFLRLGFLRLRPFLFWNMWLSLIMALMILYLPVALSLILALFLP